MQVKQVNGLEFWYRPNTSDLLMLGEGDYRHIEPLPTDRIMDIGANCGVNVIKWAQKCEQLQCWEPHPENFEVLQRNVDANDLQNCHLKQAAISNYNGEMQFWYNERARNRHSAASLKRNNLSTTSVDVRVVDFLTAVYQFQPTIIKMDIEGAEFEALADVSADQLPGVHTLCVEVHLTKAKYAEEWIEALRTRFADWQFTRQDQPRLYGNLTATVITLKK